MKRVLKNTNSRKAASNPFQVIRKSQGNPAPGVTFKKNPPFVQKNLKINTDLPVYYRAKPSASCSYGKTPACGSVWCFITYYFGFLADEYFSENPLFYYDFNRYFKLMSDKKWLFNGRIIFNFYKVTVP
jgi:hypothetical protein